ncbi:MAG: serine hydrolase domain-containing protein, partial [Bacteroidota bacterium]
MNRLSATLFFSFFMVCSLSLNVLSAQDFQAEIQKVLDEQGTTIYGVDAGGATLNFGGISAALVVPDGSFFTAVAGQATPIILVDDTQLFGLSDVGQLVLSVLTMAMLEEGTINLDAKVSDYADLSMLTNVSGDVSLRQLMGHTAGLDNFSDADDYSSTVLFDVNKVFTPSEITQSFVDELVPLGNFNYANTSFLVLGLALEGANGNETLQETLERLILSKAGISGEMQFYESEDP